MNMLLGMWPMIHGLGRGAQADAERAAAMQAELARAREEQIRARETQMIEMAQQVGL